MADNVSNVGSKLSKDTLRKAYYDEEAIQLIMDSYGVSFLDAITLWSLFLETVEKAQEISENINNS